MEKHYVDISTMFQEADDALFRTILSNRSDVLYTYLSERPEIAYSLRTRNHNKFLIPKSSDLGNRHLIIRSLYKKFIPRRSYKSNLYVDTFVTIAFHYIYMCMNFAHSCVWQLFLKTTWDDLKPNQRQMSAKVISGEMSAKGANVRSLSPSTAVSSRADVPLLRLLNWTTQTRAYPDTSRAFTLDFR